MEEQKEIPKVNIYILCDITAPQKREAKAMWLVEYVRENNPFDPITRKGFVEFAEATEDSIVLTALIKALSILHKKCEIRIFTKARGILATLDTRRYEGWRSQKWLNPSQNMVKNAELWEIFIGLLEYEQHKWSTSTEAHSFESLMETELKKWHKA